MTFPAPKPAPALVLPDYQRWIRERPCIACLYSDGRIWYASEAAHVKTRRNAGDVNNLVPLCGGPAGHHAEQHRIGIKSFERKYGFDLERKAAEYQRWYDEKEGCAF